MSSKWFERASCFQWLFILLGDIVSAIMIILLNDFECLSICGALFPYHLNSGYARSASDLSRVDPSTDATQYQKSTP